MPSYSLQQKLQVAQPSSMNLEDGTAFICTACTCIFLFIVAWVPSTDLLLAKNILNCARVLRKANTNRLSGRFFSPPFCPRVELCRHYWVRRWARSPINEAAASELSCYPVRLFFFPAGSPPSHAPAITCGFPGLLPTQHGHGFQRWKCCRCCGWRVQARPGQTCPVGHHQTG